MILRGEHQYQIKNWNSRSITFQDINDSQNLFYLETDENIDFFYSNVLFYHEQAFAHSEQVLAEIQRKMGQTHMHFIQVPTEAVSINDAVKSYLFNNLSLS